MCSLTFENTFAVFFSFFSIFPSCLLFFIVFWLHDHLPKSGYVVAIWYHFPSFFLLSISFHCFYHWVFFFGHRFDLFVTSFCFVSFLFSRFFLSLSDYLSGFSDAFSASLDFFFCVIKQLIFGEPIAPWWYRLANPVDGLVVMLAALIDYFSLTHSLILIVATASHYSLSYLSVFFLLNWIRYVTFAFFLKILFTLWLTTKYLHFICLRGLIRVTWCNLPWFATSAKSQIEFNGCHACSL